MAKKQFSVALPYIKGLTANHAYIHTAHGGRRLTRMAENWLLIASMIFRTARENSAAEILPKSRIITNIEWRGPREPDKDNATKVLWDALKRAIGVDDKYFELGTFAYEYKSVTEAQIFVTVEWQE
jgi:hypothetical protein